MAGPALTFQNGTSIKLVTTVGLKDHTPTGNCQDACSDIFKPLEFEAILAT
jgi:hypothetical protein